MLLAALHGHGSCMSALLQAGAAKQLDATLRAKLLAVALVKGMRGSFLTTLLPTGFVQPDLLEQLAHMVGAESDVAALAVSALDAATCGRLPALVLHRMQALYWLV